MSDAAAWDAKYADPAFLFGTAPNLHLRGIAHRLRPGMRALALGDGEGRNSVFLAQQGLAVTAVDWSARGQAKAAALAAAEGVLLEAAQRVARDAPQEGTLDAPQGGALDCVTADLTTWAWPVATFDLVAWIYVHLPPADRAVVAAAAAQALAPGGLLVLEAFAPAASGRRAGGPREPSLLWTRAEVERLFPGLQVLELLEGAVWLDEGPKHQGTAEVVRALLRRPG